LALFGRRPPQRVEGFVMPASKKLNIGRYFAAPHGQSITPLREKRCDRSIRLV
jgi:hypothetical protein